MSGSRSLVLGVVGMIALSLPWIATAAEFRVNMVFQHGSPVLRRDDMGLRFETQTFDEARAMAKAWVDELKASSIQSPRLRNLAYRIMTSLGFPQGFFIEKLYLELDGETVWECKFRLAQFPFLRLYERTADGGRAGNYYHYSQGWRLKASTNPIIEYVKPRPRFWEVGGMPWVPPDTQAPPPVEPLP